MTTEIELLDKIERTTRRYYRAKAQARNAEGNIALSISCAPSDTGLRNSGQGSRVELGAILQVEAEEKAREHFRDLQALRDQLKPFYFQMPEGAEKTAVRMYYLRGQSFSTIAGKLTRRDKKTWTADKVLSALQRGAMWLKANTIITNV